ncbi:MAG: hypothetical protein JXB47_13595 [Anaerolineae bacterium]|nr:hypothetical protein [Anaerolineae bacterium]
MTINKYFMPAGIIVILFTTILIAGAAGWWQTSGKASIAPGELDADGVRGWMTLEDVATGAGIPIGELYTRLGLPTDIAPATALKDVEKIVEGFEVGTVRDVVAAGSETPDVEEATPEVTEEPAAEPTLTPVPDGEGQGGPPADRPEDEETEVLLSIEIKGKMTLQEVADAGGVDLDALYEALGFSKDAAPPDALLRDLKDSVPGFTINAVRAALAQLAPELVVEE